MHLFARACSAVAVAGSVADPDTFKTLFDEVRKKKLRSNARRAQIAALACARARTIRL